MLLFIVASCFESYKNARTNVDVSCDFFYAVLRQATKKKALLYKYRRTAVELSDLTQKQQSKIMRR